MGKRKVSVMEKNIIAALAFIFFFLASTKANSANYYPWIAYYSDKAQPESFQPYKLIVFDSEYHPPLSSLLNTHKTILGYISLGEAEKERDYFTSMQKRGFLLKENPHWPGSLVIDIRRSEWQKMVIETLIPALLKNGFNGIFIDTLDSPLALEEENPRYYAGMKRAAVHLIKSIRKRYPSLPIMVNRAYEILPEIAPHITMQLGESVYTDYDPDTKTYGPVKEQDYRQQVELLQHAKRINPQLTVFTLDYWNPSDRAGIKHIYDIQRKNGFYPYVSTVLLDKVIEPEPPQ